MGTDEMESPRKTGEGRLLYSPFLRFWGKEHLSNSSPKAFFDRPAIRRRPRGKGN